VLVHQQNDTGSDRAEIAAGAEIALEIAPENGMVFDRRP